MFGPPKYKLLAPPLQRATYCSKKLCYQTLKIVRDTWHLPFPFSAKHSHLPFLPKIPIHHSHLPFLQKIPIHHSHLTYLSTVLHLSAINRRFGFIETHQEKHIESWNEDLLFQIFRSFFSQPFLTIASSFSMPSNNHCFIINLNLTFQWSSRNLLTTSLQFEIQTNFVSPLNDHICP